LKRLLVYVLYVLARLARVAIDEVFHQQKNLLSSLSRRRNLNWEDIQPIKQIVTERPSADSGLQVTVRCVDHPDVSVYWTRPANTFKLMLLQNTQEGNLGLGWKFFTKEYPDERPTRQMSTFYVNKVNSPLTSVSG
jgi:hypothetical protein